MSLTETDDFTSNIFNPASSPRMIPTKPRVAGIHHLRKKAAGSRNRSKPWITVGDGTKAGAAFVPGGGGARASLGDFCVAAFSGKSLARSAGGTPPGGRTGGGGGGGGAPEAVHSLRRKGFGSFTASRKKWRGGFGGAADPPQPIPPVEYPPQNCVARLTLPTRVLRGG